MQKRIFLLKAIALVLLLVFVPSMVLAKTTDSKDDMVTIPRAEYERLKQYALLDEVRQNIEAYYYQAPDEQKMMDGAIQGLLSGLGDSYTFYYPKEAWKKLWEDNQGKYAGIGVMMQGKLDSSVMIVRVFRNTPAEAAGLKKGDIILKVGDNIEVNTTTMQDAVNYMRGKPGEKAHIEVFRNGETLKFELIKAEITVNRLESKMLDNKVGYIALYEFEGDCAPAFKKAYEELKNSGMTSLIIDLRDNGGGWVESGVSIADMFLDKQLLYYTEDRNGNQEKTFTSDGKETLPLVILVNENSASTSEIFSAAMKDYHRATLVGTKTFGKGIIQYVIGLSDKESGYQFTCAQYFSPLGHKVHKEGIVPDVEVKMPDELKSHFFETGDLTDPQLKEAYQQVLKLTENTK